MYVPYGESDGVCKWYFLGHFPPFIAVWVPSACPFRHFPATLLHTDSHRDPTVHPMACVIERAWVWGSDWGRVWFPALPRTSCKILNMFGSDRMTFLQVFSSKVDVSMCPLRFSSGQEHCLKPTNHPPLSLGHPIPSIQSPEIDDYSGLNKSQSKKTLRNHTRRSVTLKLFSIYLSVFTKTFS